MSVFLIIVVLLGVFFSMGYFVARNSPTTAAADVASRQSNPIVVENTSKSPSPASDSAQAASPSTPSSRENAGTERDRPPAETRTQPPLSLEPAGKPTPMPVRERPVEAAPKPSVGEPQPGQTFLQVVATARPDAELIAETLAKKGFHTSVAPGPSSVLFRVLVGPLNGAADAAETRVRLEAAGFKNPYVRKY